MRRKHLLHRGISLLAAAVMACTPLPQTDVTHRAVTAAAVEDTVDEGFTYTVENGEVTITGCDTNAVRLNLPNTVEGLPVTKVANTAFKMCLQLEAVRLPEGVTVIGENTFSNLHNLQEVLLPTALETIEQHAFWNCNSLKEITFPASLRFIGKEAFGFCAALTEVTLPPGIEVLDQAFNFCTGLTAVSIPASVTEISESFGRCTALRAYTVDPENPAYQSIDGVLYTKDGTRLLLYPPAKPDTAYVVERTVTAFGNDAFRYCRLLQELTIPEGVESLSALYGLFQGCTALRTVTLPRSLREIGKSTFNYDCLTDIYYAGSVQDWGRIEVGDYNPGLYHAVVHFAQEDTAVHQRILLYTAPSALSVPADHASYQIEAGPDAAFAVIAGSCAEVSETGLVKSAKNLGETIIRITDGAEMSFLHVTTQDYVPVYADAAITAFLEEHITPEMTDTEKLEIIGKLPASMDYDADHWDYPEMLAYHAGNCAGSAAMLVEMCRRLGIRAWVRNANRDPGAGSAHVNALAEVDGICYELEAGYAGTAPRPYTVTRRTSLYKYKDAADGIDVYQYDGIDERETVLELPETIDGQRVTRIGELFLKENPWVRSVTVPASVTVISESAFPDFQGILYGAPDSAAAAFAAAHGIAFRVTGGLAPGDVNADLQIDLLDAIALNQNLLGISMLNTSQTAAADVNADSTVTAADSLLILQYTVHLADTLG